MKERSSPPSGRYLRLAPFDSVKQVQVVCSIVRQRGAAAWVSFGFHVFWFYGLPVGARSFGRLGRSKELIYLHSWPVYHLRQMEPTDQQYM